MIKLFSWSFEMELIYINMRYVCMISYNIFGRICSLVFYFAFSLFPNEYISIFSALIIPILWLLILGEIQIKFYSSNILFSMYTKCNFVSVCNYFVFFWVLAYNLVLVINMIQEHHTKISKSYGRHILQYFGTHPKL